MPAMMVRVVMVLVMEETEKEIPLAVRGDECGLRTLFLVEYFVAGILREAVDE
jgi:hypothetical protein